jgi:hypothetical protein
VRPKLPGVDGRARCKRGEADQLRDVVRGVCVLCLGRG